MEESLFLAFVSAYGWDCWACREFDDSFALGCSIEIDGLKSNIWHLMSEDYWSLVMSMGVPEVNEPPFDLAWSLRDFSSTVKLFIDRENRKSRALHDMFKKVSEVMGDDN